MILLVGAGKQAIEYAKILKALGQEFVCVGRGKESADELKSQTDHDVIEGGIVPFTSIREYEHVIVATSILDLDYSTRKVLDYEGVRNVLVEKPVSLMPKRIIAIHQAKKGAEIYVAYNRRFLQTVQKAKEIIDSAEMIHHAYFEFGDFDVNLTSHPDTVKGKWVIAQSSHVIDLMFHLIGRPVDRLAACIVKAGTCEWHGKYTKASNFTGAGLTEKGVMFNYWTSFDFAGRWNLEVWTSKGHIQLKPLEELRLDGKLILSESSKGFKPGMYEMVKSFLGDKKDLKTLMEQLIDYSFYERVGGYPQG